MADDPTLAPDGSGGPVIRPATTDDAPSLAALSMEVWLGTYLRDGIDAFFAEYALAQFTAGRFEDALRSDDTLILVSQVSEGIDGYVRLAFGSTADCPGCSDTEIATLYVRPHRQGRSVGSHLVSAVLDACKVLGSERPWLAVNSENLRALSFYATHGFIPVGRTRFRIRDRSYANDVLSIDLQPRATRPD